MIRSYNCLYTTQKTKKRKAWCDGILKIRLIEIGQSSAPPSNLRMPLTTGSQTPSGNPQSLHKLASHSLIASSNSTLAPKCQYSGTGYLVSADQSSLRLEQALSSRPLTPDEINLLMSNDVVTLEMDSYLISIEADPSQWVLAGCKIKQNNESFSNLTNPTAETTFKHILKLPKFKVPSSKPPVSQEVRESNVFDNTADKSSGSKGNNSFVSNNKKMKAIEYRDSIDNDDDGDDSQGEDCDEIDEIWSTAHSDNRSTKLGGLIRRDRDYEFGQRSGGAIESDIMGNGHSDNTSYRNNTNIAEASKNSCFIDSSSCNTSQILDSVLPAPPRKSYDPLVVWGVDSSPSCSLSPKDNIAKSNSYRNSVNNGATSGPNITLNCSGSVDSFSNISIADSDNDSPKKSIIIASNNFGEGQYGINEAFVRSRSNSFSNYCETGALGRNIESGGIFGSDLKSRMGSLGNLGSSTSDNCGSSGGFNRHGSSNSFGGILSFDSSDAVSRSRSSSFNVLSSSDSIHSGMLITNGPRSNFGVSRFDDAHFRSRSNSFSNSNSNSNGNSNNNSNSNSSNNDLGFLNKNAIGNSNFGSSNKPSGSISTYRPQNQAMQHSLQQFGTEGSTFTHAGCGGEESSNDNKIGGSFNKNCDGLVRGSGVVSGVESGVLGTSGGDKVQISEESKVSEGDGSSHDASGDEDPGPQPQLGLPCTPFFKDIDSEFNKLVSFEDADVLYYRGCDVLVQDSLDLPVVLSWPESKVTLTCSVDIGDVYFSLQFIPAPDEGQELDDVDIQQVVEMVKIASAPSSTSDSDAIEEGTVTFEFEAPCEGIALCIWDNTHDWWSNKLVSYSIKVEEPAFRICDEDRALFCQDIVRKVNNNLEIDCYLYADVIDSMGHKEAVVQQKEKSLNELERALSSRYEEFTSLQQEMSSLEDLLRRSWNKTIPGLHIRSLDRFALIKIFEYASFETVAPVCSYWHQLVNEARQLDSIASPTKSVAGKVGNDENEERGESSLSLEGFTRFNIDSLIKKNELFAKVLEKKERIELVNALKEKWRLLKDQELQIEQQLKAQSATAAEDSNIAKRIPMSINSNTSRSKSVGNNERRAAAKRVSFEGQSINELIPPADHIRAGASAGSRRYGQVKDRQNPAQNSGGKKKPFFKASDPGSVSRFLTQDSGEYMNNNDDSKHISKSKNNNKTDGDDLKGDNFNIRSSSKEIGLPTNKNNTDKPNTIEANNSSLFTHYSSTQMNQINAVDFVRREVATLERLHEKRKALKLKIKQWTSEFERQHSRAPTSREKDESMRRIYEDFQSVSLKYTLRCDRLDETLRLLGLQPADVDRVRYGTMAEALQVICERMKDSEVVIKPLRSSTPNSRRQ